MLGLLVSAVVAACSPATETSREKGTTDANGYALVQASSPGDNHHYSVDVTLRSAPEGTYALLYSTAEPKERNVVLKSTDSAIRCASAHGRECLHDATGSVILSVSKVGPGGVGVLRTTFDVGTGGWFSIARVVDGVEFQNSSNVGSGAASYDFVIISEAIAKDEEPHRFAIVVH